MTAPNTFQLLEQGCRQFRVEANDQGQRHDAAASSEHPELFQALDNQCC